MAELDEAAIFNAARKIELSSDREAYLSEACGDDREMYERVATLLGAYDARPDFLESPPVEIGPRIDTASISEGPGTVIGRYKLLELIGEGGFAVVYMAEQTEPMRRQVALKIIKLGMDTRQVIARFEAERQALAMMDHPGIADVYDAGATETGRPYFVMQLIRGVPITEYCDQNKLTTEARLRLFLDVCHAVQHAHQKGIIHRDIKPSIVLVALHDGRPVPKVIDFGIAKATHQRLTEKTLYTNYRQIIGTPQYMSPEQAEFSDLDVDTRSDIYSLGVLLYELLTSTTPFSSDELEHMGYDEICSTIRHSDPPTPSRRLSSLGDAVNTAAKNRQLDPAGLRKLLRGDLDWIVMKALEKDRTRRYATAQALGRDIERCLTGEPIEAKRDSALYVLRKTLRRYKVPVALAASLALLLTSVAIVMSIMYQNQRRLTSEAERAEGTANQARQEAERSEAKARRLLYISDMNAAGHAWENNDITLLEDILTSVGDDNRRGPRGFEWRYLLHQYQTIANTPRLKSAASGAVAFSHDGTLLAVGHTDGSNTLWHKTGDGWLEVGRFGESDVTRFYTSLAFSPENGSDCTLAYPNENTIRLLNVSSGEEYALPEVHEAAVWDVAFSKDGQLLASGGADTKVVIWDVASRAVHKILEGHTGTRRSHQIAG